MVRVTFVAADGNETELNARLGDSLMATAVDAGLDGIVGECGGNMECGTCHVYVDDGLSCQIKVKPEYDGLIVRIPDRQY